MLINIAIKGIKKCKFLFLEYAPAKRATAPIAVKLSGCGITIDRTPKRIKVQKKKILFIDVLFIFKINV